MRVGKTVQASIRADSVYVHCRVRGIILGWRRAILLVLLCMALCRVHYIMPGYWPAVRSASACTCRNLS